MPADHFYRLGEKYNNSLFTPASVIFPKFLFTSFLQDNCIAQDWNTDISEYNPKCHVSITLRYEVGNEEHKLLGAPNKEDRNEIFTSYKRGAMELLNLPYTRKDHFDLDKSYQKNIVIYSRQLDGDAGRRIVKPEIFADKLRTALPEFNVILIHGLTKLTIAERITLFDSASVFIAPHGGWAPNMMFMNDERSFYPRLVLTLEKPWLPVARFSYDEWDAKFATRKMDVMFVTHIGRLRGAGHAPYGQGDGTIFTNTMHLVDPINGDLEITDATEFITIIQRQFSEEVADCQLNKLLFHELRSVV